jgi:hypothetical protein|tara:strand:- start:201 stop:401 length:201 start_codon:yes stop_codon:yes gene_type:complete
MIASIKVQFDDNSGEVLNITIGKQLLKCNSLMRADLYLDIINLLDRQRLNGLEEFDVECELHDAKI